jgi:hypothetical protein
MMTRRRCSLVLVAMAGFMGCGGPESPTESEMLVMTVVPQGGPTAASSIAALPFGETALVLESTSPESFASQLFGYTADEAGMVDVWLRSGEFDARLVAHLADGSSRENDDMAMGTTDSRLRLTLAEGEHVRIEATTFAPGTGGAATLELQPVVVDEALLLPSNGTVTGSLSEEVTELRYWAELTRGQQLHLRLRSAEVDTVVAVESPQGLRFENDDAGDTEDGTARATDSTLEVVAGTTGLYEVIVTSFGGNEVGSWSLDVQMADPVRVLEGAQAPVGGFAGSKGRGLVLGLFAGITDYADGPLYHCAEDAEDMGQALSTRGLQAAADRQVLTNEAATMAAFETGMRDLAARSTADDVVVIFYSGHGGVQPDTSAPGTDVELDGTDETLVFIDGQMTDDKFARLLDGITADTIIVALDACQSGGFRRDIMTRPGRIGLFSSDEDVLSDTAEPLESGGYLSFTLRESILGLGDTRPVDGMLTAGELVDAMVDGFARYHRTINPTSQIAPSQRLVVDRGSVGWDSRLWIYPFGAGDELYGAAAIPASWTAPVGEESDQNMEDPVCDPVQFGLVGGVCGG